MTRWIPVLIVASVCIAKEAGARDALADAPTLRNESSPVPSATILVFDPPRDPPDPAPLEAISTADLWFGPDGRRGTGATVLARFDVVPGPVRLTAFLDAAILFAEETDVRSFAVDGYAGSEPVLFTEVRERTRFVRRFLGLGGAGIRLPVDLGSGWFAEASGGAGVAFGEGAGFGVRGGVAAGWRGAGVRAGVFAGAGARRTRETWLHVSAGLVFGIGF